MDERTAALEQLYRERYPAFRDVMAGISGSYETGREIVQEAFAVALRERKRFRGEGSLESWVWKIAFRLALKNKRDLRVVADDHLDSAPAEEPAAGPDIRNAMRKLPPRRRLIIFLRYFADLSYAEIAEACGVSEGTVAATLAQARDELLELLQEEEVAL